MKTNIFLFFFTFIITNICFGQKSVQSNENDWLLIHSKDQVEFYSKTISCYIEGFKLPLDYSVLKIVNSNPSKKSISFNFGIQYSEGCSGCAENSENSTSITLEANSTKIAECNNKEQLIRLIKNPNLKGGWNFEKPIITNLSIQ